MKIKMKLPGDALSHVPIDKPVAATGKTWTRGDGVELVVSARESLFNIYTLLNEMNMILKLYPYQQTEPSAIASILGVEEIGVGKLAEIIKNGFLMLRNFFLKLKDATISFFKYMFDVNSKSRKAISNAMTRYNRNQGTVNKEASPVVSLISYSDMMSVLELLGVLYTEANAVYKSNKKESIPLNVTALKAFGYQVDDYKVVNTDNSIEIPLQQKPFLSNDSSWGWNVQTLTKVSDMILVQLSKAEKLNYIKDKIDNDIKSSMYTIDRYNSIGDAEAAIKLQAALNSTAVVSGFLFNCSVIFQKKIDNLTAQVLNCWNALNNVPAV